MIFSPNEGREATKTEQAIIASIDAAMLSKNKEQARRQYLGASRVGEECSRRLAYEYHMVEKDPGSDFKGKTLRVFDMGHDGEERMADYLRLAGFELQTHTAEGKQIGMSDAEGKFKGHLDGVIHAGPLTDLKYPMLWENKALGQKSWSDVVKKGIKLSKPVYYAQVQIYMAYHELELCMFTCLNRDTGEIHVELIPLVARDAQDYVDKAVRIVTSANPEELGRIGKGADFACKFCDYKKRCHAPLVITGTTVFSTPAPNQWLGSAPKQDTVIFHPEHKNITPTWLKK
jgi:hypothetical protein